MTSLVKSTVYLVWLALILLTATSWALGTSHGLPASAHHGGRCRDFAVAVFKARLVGLHFMELKSAPWALRGVFEAYLPDSVRVVKRALLVSVTVSAWHRRKLLAR